MMEKKVQEQHERQRQQRRREEQAREQEARRQQQQQQQRTASGSSGENESLFKGEGLKTSLALLGTVAAAAYAVHKAWPMVFGDEESDKEREKEREKKDRVEEATSAGRGGPGNRVAAGEKDRERGRDWGREYGENYRYQRNPPQEHQQRQRNRRGTDADLVIIEEMFRVRPPQPQPPRAERRQQQPPVYDGGGGRREGTSFFADRRSVPANMRPRRYDFLQDDDKLDEFVLYEDQIIRGRSVSNRGGSLGGAGW